MDKLHELLYLAHRRPVANRKKKKNYRQLDDDVETALQQIKVDNDVVDTQLLQQSTKINTSIK